MLRGDQYFIATGAGQVFVDPAEAERKVEIVVCQQVIERLPQQPRSREPVVLEAESVQAVCPREFDLTALDVDQPQIVETQLPRHMRLEVALEPRPAARDV